MRLDFATIAAISTPSGTSGIGVIRISGEEAAAIAGRIFRRPDGRLIALRDMPSHTVHFGHIRDPETGAVIDEVLLTWMAAPRSYTTEDTVEISCHGGQLPLQNTLRVVLAAGARHAEAGEFTLRAFLNGRLDLSQAEAVLGVVEARTSTGLQLAVEDLRGDLARRIAPASAAVVSLLAYLDAAADFPDDEIPGTDVDADLETAVKALEGVVAGSRAGMLYREGAQVALVGRPNVGKSSLLNALLRADRAIVTPIAGTTRDVIAETCAIRGIPVTLLDTAGIAESADIVEKLGIERSQRVLTSAAAAILVLDGTVEPGPDDLAVAMLLTSRLADASRGSPPVAALPSPQRSAPVHEERGPETRDSSSPLRSGRDDHAPVIPSDIEEPPAAAAGPPDPESTSPLPVVIAINKRDLSHHAAQDGVLDLLPGVAVVALSSKTGAGIDALETALAAVLTHEEVSAVQPALITTRQKSALDRALAHLQDAESTFAAGYPIDLMATDVRAALHAIGEVTGENIDEAVLTEIFSRFCIGK